MKMVLEFLVDTCDYQMKGCMAKLSRKYSFEGKKRTLAVDQDIWDHSQQYVVDQIAIMKRHGAAPEPPLTKSQFEDLVYAVAKYPQQIRNLRDKEPNDA